MRRVGVTQRVDVHLQTGERRDALDQNWAVFLAEADCVAVPLPNRSRDPEGLIGDLALEAVLLSGGNDLAHISGARNAAPERDALETALVGACGVRSLPVLGVCRGAQMLNHLGGGQIVPLPGHVVPRHRVTPLPPALPLLGEAFDIAGYHDFGIADSGLAPGLQPLALADDGSVEAFRDASGLQMGILWHPEREAPYRQADIDLVRRFFGRQAW